MRRATGHTSPSFSSRVPAFRSRLAFALLLVITALAITAPSASAHVVGHRFERTIAGSGSNALTNPTDVAVDDSAGSSAGDIYVADPAKHRVEKFSPGGEFLLMLGDEVNATTHGNVCTAVETCETGTASSAPGGFQTPTFVAVDGSSSSSAGDVYVGDTGDHLISKFNPSDEIIASWASAGQLSFATISGLAVDRTGNLFVGTELKLFEDNANAVEVRNCELSSPASSDGLAVEGSDNIFELTAEGKVQTLSDECTDAQIEDAATNATGLAVNPAESGENDLYVDQGGSAVDHFVAGCTLPDCESADTFGSGHLSAARGIAIANSGTVYVADPGAADVAVFPNHTLPDLSLASPNTQLTSATLSGHVDPDSAHGGGEITACEFEYVDQSEFEAHEFSAAAKVSCAPAVPYSEPKEVTAHISGLTKHTTYHYRLSATTEQGTSESPDHTFTTSPTNLFTSSFGAASSSPANPYPLDEPNGVAIEEKTGDVYVIDAGNHRIEKFGPAGELLLIFGKEVNATNHGNVCTAAESCQPGVADTTPGAFQSPAFIAVDNSTGPSAGDVYVVDNGDLSISKFKPSGEILSSWGTSGRLLVPNGATPELVGLGVDDNGNVWTASVYPNGPNVFEFNSVGELKESVGGYYNAGFAVASSGEVYFSNAFEGAFNGFVPFAVNGSRLPGNPIPGSDLQVAPNGFSYTIAGEEVSEFNAIAELFGEPFGFGELTGPSSLAIDIPNSDVYVANSGTGNVVVFDSVAPTVTTGPAEHPNHTAITLTGEVDPLGRGEVTECEFEYGTTTAYGHTASCVPAPSYSGPTDVSAEVSGLTAETTYHYRLRASNAASPEYGADQTFFPHAVFEVKTDAPSKLERTSATLNGSFNPDSLPTTYHFEYIEAAKYEKALEEHAVNPYGEGTGTSEGGPISQSAKQSVEAGIEGLSSQSTYDYRLVAHNADGTTYGQNEPLTTVSAVAGLKTEAPTEVSPESAVLHGSYEGDSEGGDVHCYFQYGTDESYGHNTEEPPGADQGSAVELHQIEAKVTGLSPRHTYYFSLVCENHIGKTVGKGEHFESGERFETPEPPTVDGLISSNLTQTSADLTAEINPQGFATKYHFEFGTTTNYGTEVPSPEAEITGTTGELSTDHPVEVHLESLQQGTVYHFRLTATNKYGTTTTEDQSFNFYPPHCPNEALRQQTNSSFLPDCRAYELVSPGNAGSVILGPGDAPSSSYAVSPARFAFFGLLGEIPGGDSPNYNGTAYIATREPTGWVTHYVGIPGDEHHTELEKIFTSSTSLEKTIDFARRGEEGQPPLEAPFAWDAEGNPLGQWPADVSSIPGGESTEGMFQPSPDFSHLAFSSSNVVFPTGEASGQPAHQGQVTPPGSAYDYDTETATTDLISVLPNGANIPQAPGYSAENLHDNILFPGEPEQTVFDAPSTNDQGVSTDGSHILLGLPGRQVFFKALPNERPCSLGSSCPGGPGLMQLYMRVNDAVTYDVSENPITQEPAEVEYVGMTSSGSKVFFISEEHLTDEDPDHGGTSLYMWSAEKVAAGKPPLTLVSKGNANSGQGNSADCHAAPREIHPRLSRDDGPWIPKCGVLTVQTGSVWDKNDSEAESRTDNTIAAENGDIYFYSPEQLDGSKGITGQMNLYDYRDEKLQYVTTVEPYLECQETATFCRNAPITRFQVSPDDSHAAFVTAGQITSYDTKDPNGSCSFGGNGNNGGEGLNPLEEPLDERCQEMYSYDPTTGKIVCVSCNPSGAAPTHDVSASTQGLFMSNDGRTFFSTEESLVQTDTNEVDDVYEYTEGRPQLITTGTDAADKRLKEEGVTGIHGGLAGVSADGTNVYFSTRDTLVPQDENGQYIKFYDARTDGGFPFEKPAPPCESADECHGAGSARPSSLPTGSEDGLIGGNVVAAPPPKHHNRAHKKRRHRHKRADKKNHHTSGGSK